MPVSQSDGVSVPGTIGSVTGDIVGGNKITIANIETFIQEIDAETTAKISETHDNVVQVLAVIKADVTRLRSTD